MVFDQIYYKSNADIEADWELMVGCRFLACTLSYL